MSGNRNDLETCTSAGSCRYMYYRVRERVSPTEPEKERESVFKVTRLPCSFPLPTLVIAVREIFPIRDRRTMMRDLAISRGNVYVCVCVWRVTYFFSDNSARSPLR